MIFKKKKFNNFTYYKYKEEGKTAQKNKNFSKS